MVAWLKSREEPVLSSNRINFWLASLLGAELEGLTKLRLIIITKLKGGLLSDEGSHFVAWTRPREELVFSPIGTDTF